MPPRTIDDLGPEVSSRYAADRKYYDEKQAKEAPAIPSQATIDVTTPGFSSEFDALFETSKRNPSWADFLRPPKYAEQKKRVFTHQILPSLGSDDKRQQQIQRVKSAETDEEQKKVMLTLFEKIEKLDRTLIDINTRRSQYHKG